MLFANPQILWGLFAISIPIAIHLFNLQRYKKVYFTNVRFLQQLQQQSRRQSVLRHWLVLLFRILAISSLVLAFAKPFIPSPIGTYDESGGLAAIYTDNSFSMESDAANGPLIDEAILKAREIISNHARSDKFNLETNEFKGIHHRLVSADEINTYIDDVSISPSVRQIQEVLNRQYSILNSEPTTNKTLYIISDFQRSIANFEGFTPDTSIQHMFIPLKPVRYANLSIDTCWLETPAQQPGQVMQLQVRVTNFDNNPREKIPVRLMVNGTQRALATFDIEPESSAQQTLSFTIRETGLHRGYLELNDYPITFDDRLYFSFRVLPGINVMHIYENEPGSYVRALFEPDTLFGLTESNIRQLNYAELHQQQLIILNALNRISSGLSTELSRFVENGGSVFVIPAKDLDHASYANWMQSLNTVVFENADTLRMRMHKLNILHPLFSDVFEPQADGRSAIAPETDLPWVNFRYRLTLPPRKSVHTLIELRNGEPFLVADRYGEGNIYVMTSPLNVESTTFPIHAIFVPALYKMALLSTPHQRIYNIIGSRESLGIGNLKPGTEQVFKLSGTEDKFMFIPGHRTINYDTYLYGLDAIKTAGNYSLTADQDTLLVLAFNYDRRESVPEYLNDQELFDIAEKEGITNFAVISNTDKPVGQVISELSRGRQLWKYFIVIALVFLFAEILALRFLR